MTSNTPPPVDHSALFSDPAELARWYEKEANWAWEQMTRYTRWSEEHTAARAVFERNQNAAARYRRMAARGEQVPEF